MAINIDVENKILEYNKNCGNKKYDFFKKEFVMEKGGKNRNDNNNTIKITFIKYDMY